MKKQLYATATVLLLLSASYIAGSPSVQQSHSLKTQAALPTSNQWYPVRAVIDGDTVVVNMGGADVHVRLIGINTPEVQSPYRTQECYGSEASAEAKKIMTGSDVRLVTDPSQDLYDQYGRLLAYVYIPTNSNTDGILVNDYMLQGGFAREYTFKKPYEFQARFKHDEAQAKNAGRGLWGACTSSS